jgi:site-specific recombinase XerC
MVNLEHAVLLPYTSELIPANPMPLIGRPKVAKTLPKALRTETVVELLAAIDTDDGSPRRADWADAIARWS